MFELLFQLLHRHLIEAFGCHPKRKLGAPVCPVPLFRCEPEFEAMASQGDGVWLDMRCIVDAGYLDYCLRLDSFSLNDVYGVPTKEIQPRKKARVEQPTNRDERAIVLHQTFCPSILEAWKQMEPIS